MKYKNNCRRCTLFISAAYFILFVLFTGYRLYRGEAIELKKSKADIFIPTGSAINDVTEILIKNKIVNKQKIDKYLKLYRYENVKSGRYIAKRHMSYRELIRMLASGSQTPVNLVISGNIRTKDKLAGIISKQIETDSVTLLNLLNDNDFLKELDFTENNSILLFMPDTYNVYWNRNPKQLFSDMKKSYDAFWNEARTKKLSEIGYNKDEVMIIASIAIEESAKQDELKTIAGVYINRLKKGIMLQADPTVKYAVGDFSLQRVLIKHTKCDSPYNTYMYKGLPPGPICIPSATAVDAVLNYEHHDYYYFCAKDDFSGYHVFAKTLQQHNENANAYRNALNKRKIY